MGYLVFYGLIASTLSLIGGFVVLWQAHTAKKLMTWLITFAAGAFLAVGFLDLLPEAVEMVEEPHVVFIAALVGFSLFFGLERIVMRHFHIHSHGEESHAAHTESLPLLIVLGDTIHNFLDGVVIALAYIVEPALGLTTALAVAAHEIPQEVGDFALLLDRGWSKMRIAGVNIVSSLGTLVGVTVGYFAVSLFEGLLAYLLAGTAGVFIYIAASDLIPEIHHRGGHQHGYRILMVFVASIALIGYLISTTH